jgi:hypothetical protein
VIPLLLSPFQEAGQVCMMRTVCVFVFLSGVYLWCVRVGALMFQVSGWDVNVFFHMRIYFLQA